MAVAVKVIGVPGQTLLVDAEIETLTGVPLVMFIVNGFDVAGIGFEQRVLEMSEQLMTSALVGK